MKTDKNEYPAGWNEARVRAVIAHYDNQTEEERVAEIKTALAAERRRRKKKASTLNGHSRKKASVSRTKAPRSSRRKV